MASSDIITVDAGGRLCKTSQSTLVASGSACFEAMLSRWCPKADDGDDVAFPGSDAASVTPCNENRKSRAGCAKDSEETSGSHANRQTTGGLFVDCDPDIFEDVLCFMWRDRINPATEEDRLRLKKLKIEADFFVMDSLSHACEKKLDSLWRPIAESDSCLSELGKDCDIDLEKGEVLRLACATLAGRCAANRCIALLESKESGKRCGCYLMTCDQDLNSGDFQLCMNLAGASDAFQESSDRCIAHVGKDQIHCGDRPLDFDFRCELDLCISERETKNVRLHCKGSGTWSIFCWIGYPEDIPQPSSKKRKC